MSLYTCFCMCGVLNFHLTVHTVHVGHCHTKRMHLKLLCVCVCVCVCVCARARAHACMCVCGHAVSHWANKHT